MAITFERFALYEEVWSEALTKLAKKYSLFIEFVNVPDARLSSRT
jgi:hypothetical protein